MNGAHPTRANGASRPLAALLAAGLATVALACGGDREPPPAPGAPPPPSASEPPDDGRPPAALRCPRGAPADEALDTRRLVGLTEEAARALAETVRCTVRVVERNGEPLAHTQEYRRDRVNVKVRDRVVVAIDGIG